MSRFKTLLTAFFLLFIITASAQTKPASPDAPFTQKDTTFWIYNFRQFRDAVYQRDIAKAKAFADLPFKEDNNEIWYLVQQVDEKAAASSFDASKPFTETDFKRHFDKIFPSYFMKSILKIKTEELFKKKEFTTPLFYDSAYSTNYVMIATWDKSENQLTLNLGMTGTSSNKEGDDEYVSEFNIIYILNITSKGHLKLKAIRIAG